MKKYLLAALVLNLYALDAFARGGGGGSGGGGGGGSGSGGSGGGSMIGGLLYLIVFLIFTSILWYKRRKKIEAVKAVVDAAASTDALWQADELKKHVHDTFLKFQQDWSNFNVDSMKQYLSEDYFRRMVLELNVLKNEGRRNLMEHVSCSSVIILEASDSEDDSKDRFVAEVNGQAKDTLLDERNSKELYMDTRPFTEYWTFIRREDGWKLELIAQQSESKALGENKIKEFALRNGFFYDPDFGWLMMPDKGAIFRKSSFKFSDINNHVIGYYRDKIVEFFTYIPTEKSVLNYIVAQTVIPKSYNDILVRRKRMLFNFGPWGLRKIKTESNDFDNKFCLWADPQDQISSFELLTPNFMEKIYDLPFELNIEVVGNFLYFYAKSRKDIDYDKMLEILSWAFDEMER